MGRGTLRRGSGGNPGTNLPGSTASAPTRLGLAAARLEGTRRLARKARPGPWSRAGHWECPGRGYSEAGKEALGGSACRPLDSPNDRPGPCSLRVTLCSRQDSGCERRGAGAQGLQPAAPFRPGPPSRLLRVGRVWFPPCPQGQRGLRGGVGTHPIRPGERSRTAT